MNKLITLLFLLATGSSVFAATMKAHYIDLGQADATLLEFDCGIALIDAGGQAFSTTRSEKRLMAYLKDFFDDRQDLNGTIDTILITHNHDDHTDALNKVAEEYTIKNIVSTELNLTNDVKNVVRNETGIKHRYLEYGDAKAKIPNGLFYNEIDPISCQSGNPEIKVFTGKSDVTSNVVVNGESFRKSHFSKPNNNSLVITVRYGEASFIFTGDLEEKGIEYLLANYKDHLDVLDVDIYQVGHHGSSNATTLDLLKAISPEISIISAGHTVDRKKPGSAFDHGHPNLGAVELIQSKTSGTRNQSISGFVFDGQETDPLRMKIDRQVYCTCWEHSIVVEADFTSGDYTILTNQ